MSDNDHDCLPTECIDFGRAMDEAYRFSEEKLIRGERFAHQGCWVSVNPDGSYNWEETSAMIFIIGNPGRHGEELVANIRLAIERVLGKASEEDYTIILPKGAFTTNPADPVN